MFYYLIMEKEEAANLFKVLGDVNRLKIIKILVNTGEVCACKFLNCVECGQSTLSFHLQTLADNNLVTFRKEGKKVLYKANHVLLKELMDFLYKPCANFKKKEFYEKD